MAPNERKAPDRGGSGEEGIAGSLGKDRTPLIVLKILVSSLVIRELMEAQGNFLWGKKGQGGFHGGSVVKNPPANAGNRGFDPWVGKILWREKWQAAPVFLPEKSHGQRNLAGYGLWGRKELDTT